MTLPALMQTDRPFLTDGGFETSMIFHHGFDLPCFAAFVLLESAAGRQAMESYFRHYITIAHERRTGFILDTNTWRANVPWGAQLGRTADDIVEVNRSAVAFAKGLRDRLAAPGQNVLINGVIGPAGDGYEAGQQLTPVQAQTIHAPQIRALAASGVDMVTALTMTHAGEGVGIAHAARAAKVPCVISFTVETDGTLPSGQSLPEAIAELDAATDGSVLYYMINCAHPHHFRDALDRGEGWIQRIGGLRTNASRLSHAELDVAEELDEGDPDELGLLHSDLMQRLPNIRVVGGCCGTDHRHVGSIAGHVCAPRAA